MGRLIGGRSIYSSHHGVAHVGLGDPQQIRIDLLQISADLGKAVGKLLALLVEGVFEGGEREADRQVGVRRGYYQSTTGREDASVLRRLLFPDHAR